MSASCFVKSCFLVLGQLEIGEPGDALDVFDRECGHLAMLMRCKVKGQKAKVKGEVKGQVKGV
jgi:hypothetical protein